MAKTIAVSLLSTVTKSIITNNGVAQTKYGGTILGQSKSEITIKYPDGIIEVLSFAQFTTQFAQVSAAALSDYLITNAYFA